MLELKNLKKAYGTHVVLEGINAKFCEGIYGFLGKNGVGKSSLFKIIGRYDTDFTGDVIYPSISNKDVLLGVLPQVFMGYPSMKVYDFLRYLGSVKSSVSRRTIDNDIEEKLDIFNLTQLKNKKLKSLSGGQLRRVGLAQAFQLNPKIVLLDEPTTGLDPSERIKFKNYISSIALECTILLSTHIVTDLELITKKIYIVKDKQFVMEGSEEELIKVCQGMVWEADISNELEVKRKFSNYPVCSVYDAGDTQKIRFLSESKPLFEAISVRPTLNDVYLANFGN